MISVSVLSSAESEEVRGRVDLSLLISDGEGHEEKKELCVFRFFLPVPPIAGETLSPEEYDEIELAAEASRAAVKAAGILSYGDRTAKELKERLKQKGFSPEAASEAARWACEKRYIREDEQLERLVHTLAETKKYGLARIREEIRQKGFSEDVVKAHFYDITDTVDFEEILRERIKKLPADAFSVPEKKRKTVASLMRYGFSYEEIRRCVK